MLDALEVRIARREVRKHSPRYAGERPDTTAPPGTDRLPQIEHIVVLMMENHSYDNYLGMLEGRGCGFRLGADGKPLGTNKAGDGSVIRLSPMYSTAQEADVPAQSWAASHIQYNQGRCDGFVRSIEATFPGRDATAAMRYFTEKELPFYYGLARTFPLATRWFGSCLGPTFPNRRFLVAGTANGLIDDLPFVMIDHPAAGTIFDLLTAHRISWINYHQVPPWRINLKRLIRSRGSNLLGLSGALLSGVFPSLKKSVQNKVQATAELYPLGTLRSVNHLRKMDQFWTDAAEGRLPAVSVVDPDFELNSEENPQDVQEGEAFAAKVVNAVMAGRGWPKTLLIWLYDEHGGYYDHVPPPDAVEPDGVPAANPMERFPVLGALLRFTPWRKLIEVSDAGPSTYDRLGFRVPAVVVSPYSRPDHVSDTVYDHTSILKLIEQKWNLPSLTRRDAAACDPLDTLDLDSPPSFLEPPTLPLPGIAGRR